MRYSGRDHRSDAREEASDSLEALAPLANPDILRFSRSGEAVVWLDLEKLVGNLDEQEGLEWIREWIRVVERQWPAGFYTSDPWLEREATPDEESLNLLVQRPDNTRRPFWVARYGPNDGTPHPEYDPDEKVPATWGTWDIWQHTSRGQVPGISGRCDLNLARIVA